MKKKISFISQGQKAYIGNDIVYRILPNRYADAVGPFVFLDHIPPIIHPTSKPKSKEGSGAHPHRGIATLTYILSGEGEHHDSSGHHATVYSGGAQWMKAGNGIIHDETFNVDSQTDEMMTHGFQFWINLPSKIKAEAPEYIALQASEIPIQIFSDKRGWLKVIAGKYENIQSKIPGYTKQFIYHIHLKKGKAFSLTTENEIEYAAFIPQHQVEVNGHLYQKGDFMKFDMKEGTIEISNNSTKKIDIIVFGGEKYTEPIVAQGPFVMNTQQEIAEAYRDFHAGKYGEIDYGTKGIQI